MTETEYDSRWADLTGESTVEIDGKKGKVKSFTGSAFEVTFEVDNSMMMYPLDYLRKNGKLIFLYEIPKKK